MAGEWIKMRTNLWDDPRVSSLCDETGQPEAMVVGALYWLWAMADEHSESGFLPGMTFKAIARKTGVAGLGEALQNIGWIQLSGDGVRVVNFDEHNGASAKRRSMDAKRKAGSRNVSACDADKKRTPSGARTRTREDIKPNTHTASEDHRAPVTMHLEWLPPEKLLKAYATRSGVPLNLFTPEAFGPFVIWHHARGTTKPDVEHVAALVAWVKQDQAKGARVVPLRAGLDDAFDDKSTAWIEGLK